MADARPSRPQINTPPQKPRDTRRPVRFRPGMVESPPRPDIPKNPTPTAEEIAVERPEES